MPVAESSRAGTRGASRPGPSQCRGSQRLRRLHRFQVQANKDVRAKASLSTDASRFGPGPSLRDFWKRESCEKHSCTIPAAQGQQSHRQRVLALLNSFQNSALAFEAIVQIQESLNKGWVLASRTLELPLFRETLRDSGIQCFRLGGNLLLLLHAFVHDLVAPSRWRLPKENSCLRVQSRVTGTASTCWSLRRGPLRPVSHVLAERLRNWVQTSDIGPESSLG